MALKKSKYIIGIDEVGRGTLAGNVTVAAVAVPSSRIKHKFNSRIFANRNSRLIRDIPLRDSKKLTPNQREIWFGYIKKELRLSYAVASVPPRAIDKINISKAANLAAGKAFNKLVRNCGLRIADCEVFLDGGLYLPKFLGSQCSALKSIIKGDEKIPAISLASIVAKVSRDRQMKNLSKKYPQYRLEKHKGYGTKEHFKAIKKHGPSKIHRLTFLKKMR